MIEHTLHVVGWDASVDFKLLCHMTPDAPCYADIDESGVEVGRLDSCNLVEWFENVGDEMIDGELRGSPPWVVVVDWGNWDYPVLVQKRSGDE